MPSAKTDIQTISSRTEDSLTSFDTLYQAYHQAVFINISKLIHEPQLAEDILQEVFLSLWENRHKLDNKKHIGGWLFVVSYNKSISFLKKRMAEKTVFLESLSHDIIEEESGIEVKELQLEVLSAAVNALSPRKKEVFQLCRLQGKTYHEAAVLLGMSPATIKDYMKDSLKFVREFMLANYSTASLSALPFLILYLQP